MGELSGVDASGSDVIPRKKIHVQAVIVDVLLPLNSTDRIKRPATDQAPFRSNQQGIYSFTSICLKISKGLFTTSSSPSARTYLTNHRFVVKDISGEKWHEFHLESITPKPMGVYDIQIKSECCGVCSSDVHVSPLLFYSGIGD